MSKSTLAIALFIPFCLSSVACANIETGEYDDTIEFVGADSQELEEGEYPTCMDSCTQDNTFYWCNVTEQTDGGCLADDFHYPTCMDSCTEFKSAYWCNVTEQKSGGCLAGDFDHPTCMDYCTQYETEWWCEKTGQKYGGCRLAESRTGEGIIAGAAQAL